MEEADARLQEVVASLLNEHGGNHEPALRQTFACLHNSGLYEAQSPQEEEQREQQVLAVFRSFPFRTAAPTSVVNTGADTRAEETRAPPPAYETVYNTNGNNSNGNATGINNGNASNSNNNGREPEEAGEIVAADGDPENVGEYFNAAPAVATAAPETLPPIYPVGTHGEETPAPGPEFSHQQGEQEQQQLPSQAPAQAQAPDVDVPPSLVEEVDPEASASGAVATAAEGEASQETGSGEAELSVLSLTSPATGSAEEKGEEWGEAHRIRGGEGRGARWGGGGGGFPETGAEESSEEQVVAVEVEAEGGTGEELKEGEGRQEEQRSGNSDIYHSGGYGVGFVANGAGLSGVSIGNGSAGSPGVDDDPESTTSSLETGSESASGPEVAARHSLVNGSVSSDPLPSYACFTGQDRMDSSSTPDSTTVAEGTHVNDVVASSIPTVASSHPGAAIPSASPAASGTFPGTAPRTVPGAGAYAGGSGQAVSDPHLKTGGQPLTHANRAESPTGMSTDLQDKLRQLKLRRKHRFLVMRIDGTEVVADAVGAPTEGPSELRSSLPYSDCRYAVYDQEIVTSDGRKANKLFFFTWLPHNATPHNKMAYSHGKVTVRQRLEGLYDVAASSFADIELALGLVEDDDEDSDIDF